MEKEIFLSGYCRCLDASRMVAVLLEDGEIQEVDCQFGCCPHEMNCQVAQEIRNTENSIHVYAQKGPL